MTILGGDINHISMPSDVSEPRYWLVSVYLKIESDFVAISSLSKLFGVRNKLICGDIECLKKRGADIITRKTLRKNVDNRGQATLGASSI